MIKVTKGRMGQIWQAEKVVPATYLKVVEAGQEFSALKANDRIKLRGISKGRGFAGVVKRHGFAGGPKTHGQSDRWRAPGSLGGTTTPGRVYKGKRMAGRLGHEQRTLPSRILAIDLEAKRLTVKGPVPGSYGSPVWVEKI